jgi:putative transposase
VRYINHRYHRTDTLWEGRYKACLVACDHYLLHCHRYIELNPVRARIAADPAKYRWSSHRRLAFGSPDPSIALHDAFLRLSSQPHDWMTRYRQLVLEAISPEETEVIRRHLQRQHLYGRMAYSGRSRPRQAKARGRRKWEDRAMRMRSRLSEEVDSDPCFSSPGQPSWR